MTAAQARRLLVALFVLWMCVCLFVPFSPTMPAAGIDESWRFGMNEAVTQHLRFGPQLAMTYGPFASVYTTEYAPATDAMMIGGSLLLALSYAAAIVYLMGASRLQWAVCAMLLLGGLFLLKDILFFSYVLLVAMVIHKRALADPSPRAPGHAARTVLVAVLCFALGLLPLIKGTFLVISGATLACCFVYLQLRRQRAQAWLPPIAFVCGTVLFWWLGGQRLVDFPGYLANLAPTVSGYTDAMSTIGDPGEAVLYVLTSVVVLLAILFTRSLAFSSRYLLIAVYGLYLLIAFKGGFVRHDGHVLMSGICLLLGVVYLFFVLQTRAASIALVLAVATWMVIDDHNLKTSTSSVLSNLDQLPTAAWTGFQARRENPAELPARYAAAVQAIRTTAPLPVLDGTTDLYSFDQSALIASGNRWAPRPTFQSYAAYSPGLIERNRQHLTGDGAPDHVIFRVEPIDRRLPSTEDGASWPELIARYRPVAFKGTYLFLDRRPVPADATLQPLGAPITARRNERVAVPDAGGLIFAEIQIRKTFFGKLASLLYKAEPLAIEVQFTDATRQSFRLVSSMANSAFLVSPLVNDTKDFLLLYGNAELLVDRKVSAIRVTAPGARSAMWNDEYTIAFRQMRTAAAEGVTALLDLPKFGDAPEATLPVAPHCDGNIDVLNDKPPAAVSLSARGLVKLSGWITTNAKGPGTPQAIYIVLTAADGKPRLLKATPSQRPDVATFLGNPALTGSGFSATSELAVPPGSYVLGLAVDEKGVITKCPQFSIPVAVR